MQCSKTHAFGPFNDEQKSYNEFSRAAPGTPFAHFLLPTTPFNAAGLTHAVLATYCADLQWLACLFPKAPAQQNPQITFICMEERELKAVSKKLGTAFHIVPLIPSSPF